MMRRRIRFAAPFVIITATACGPSAPAEEPAPPVVIEGMDHVARAEASPHDAAESEHTACRPPVPPACGPGVLGVRQRVST